MRFAARRSCSLAVASRRSPADEPKQPKPQADGWIDLMKPDVWKKVDPGWIVTDEVKLDPEKANAAEGREEGRRHGLGERREGPAAEPHHEGGRSATARSTSSS